MSRVKKLRAYLQKYYAEHGQNLLFHGWHHIVFVTDKATALAQELNIADPEMVVAAALTHDLNYLVDSYSLVEVGRELRTKILAENGYTPQDIAYIEEIVDTSDKHNRGEVLSLESQILSDADTLFKVLPVTPAILTAKYLEQSKVGLRQVANSILRYQLPLFEKGIYFYTEPYQARYMKWAEQNLRFWQTILDALDDEDTCKMLETAGVKI